MEFNKDESTVKQLLLSDTVSKYLTLILSPNMLLWYCLQISYPDTVFKYVALILSPNMLPWYCLQISYPDTVSKYVTHYCSWSVFLYCNQATLPYHIWPTYWSDHDLIVMAYWLCLILCQVFMVKLISQLPYNLSSPCLIHTLIMVGTYPYVTLT
jgi:hypothetical protein